MIDSQLRTSGVNADYVLARMSAVAREDFVPPASAGVAYVDRAIPLGGGRWLAAPLFHGMMLQEARPTSGDKVLLVEGGSGYLAELLRPLVGSLEVISPEQALSTSRKGGYDLLLIDGAIEQLPRTLTKRLADDARIVGGLAQDGVTRLVRGRKTPGGEAALLPLAEMGIPLLPEFATPKGWTF